MKKIVPVLITWDVDPTPEATIEHKKIALKSALDLLNALEIKSTFLFVASIANIFKEEISLLIENGQEIGCHGLTHDSDEEYDKMPPDMQQEYLTKATEILTKIANKPMTTFRGPRVKTSHITHRILENLGYSADVSISPQRIDFISSNLINIGWIFAPRKSYHPSKDNVFKKGNRKIWVIPISATIFPFISSTLNIFGLSFMKLFFRTLYAETLRTNKPIVYLIHPEEFAPDTIKIKSSGYSLKMLRTHGFAFRSKLYIKDPKKRFDYNKNLFMYMKSFPYVKFLAVNEYVSLLDLLPHSI